MGFGTDRMQLLQVSLLALKKERNGPLGVWF